MSRPLCGHLSTYGEWVCVAEDGHPAGRHYYVAAMGSGLDQLEPAGWQGELLARDLVPVES